MKTGDLFPVADFISNMDRSLKLMAQYTGEKRPPKMGEWYLSGAIIEAYKAENDLTTPFHIAKIVVVESVTIVKTTVIEDYNTGA